MCNDPEIGVQCAMHASAALEDAQERLVDLIHINAAESTLKKAQGEYEEAQREYLITPQGQEEYSASLRMQAMHGTDPLEGAARLAHFRKVAESRHELQTRMVSPSTDEAERWEAEVDELIEGAQEQDDMFTVLRHARYRLKHDRDDMIRTLRDQAWKKGSTVDRHEMIYRIRKIEFLISALNEWEKHKVMYGQG